MCFYCWFENLDFWGGIFIRIENGLVIQFPNLQSFTAELSRGAELIDLFCCLVSLSYFQPLFNFLIRFKCAYSILLIILKSQVFTAPVLRLFLLATFILPCFFRCLLIHECELICLRISLCGSFQSWVEGGFLHRGFAFASAWEHVQALAHFKILIWNLLSHLNNNLGWKSTWGLACVYRIHKGNIFFYPPFIV